MKYGIIRNSHRPEGLQLYQKETPTQVFSGDYCEIFKNIFFTKHLWTTASLQYECFGPELYLGLRGGSGTAATSKMEHFVIIVNG